MSINSNSFERLLFIDFDNTYYIDGINYKKDIYQKRFSKIREITLKKKICTIILSGNNINFIKNKIKENRMYVPDIIFGSLGTQFKLNFKDNQLNLLLKKRLGQKINIKNIESFIEDINIKNKILFKQPLKYNTSFKKSYYCINSNLNFNNKKIIINKSKEYNLNVKICKCSTESVAEDGLCDIDIIPKNAGKKNTLIFLKNYFKISYKSIYVLGDSMNDYEMLKMSTNSFLVKKSSKDIVNKFKQLNKNDASAILEIIKNI